MYPYGWPITVRLGHRQMNQHYVETATEYQVSISKGFQRLSSETADARYLCEIKRATEVDSTVVQKRAKAAIQWCERASAVSS